MLIEIVLLIITLVWLSFATYFDIKTQEIPDWLSYSLIIIGFVLSILKSNPSYILIILGLLVITSIFYYIEKELKWVKGYILIVISAFIYFFVAAKLTQNIFSSSILGFLIFFIIGDLMYHSKQWGGGDVKLLAGLGIVFATYPKVLLTFLNPNLNLPFLIILFINILIAGAFYGIIWTFVLAIKDKKKFSLNLKKILHMKKVRLLESIVFILTLVLLLVAFFTVQDLRIRLFALFLGILPLFFLYLLILVKSIENMSFIKKIPISKIRIEDQIQNDIFYKGKKIYSKKSLGVTKAQLALIKKAKIKSVIIKEGIPFVPSFLIGVLISLIFGSLIFF
ncbi:MAG: prepilin peptidase [Nanoarchaeota archaeon]|nr:prepilin peptidase [Nanoarchaeota archaeon]